MTGTPPNRSERQQCWNARDAYFNCLKQNGEDKTKCVEAMTGFEENCPKRWVKYFIGLRAKEKLREKLEKQGAVFADEKKK